MYRGGGIYYYHKDALGSVYQMTDEDENVVRSYDYSAFGTIISESGSLANPFTYTAREYDSNSELYYYRARYYDAAVGRFLSRDPIMSFNFYPYVENNPINSVDPSGELPPVGCIGCVACAGGWIIGCYYQCFNLYDDPEAWDCVEDCIDDMLDYIAPGDPTECGPHELICKTACLWCAIWLFDIIRPILPRP